ncbi:MAG: trehalose-phosphatase [Candidatus Omnitrophica bacterium]|nr:trehalose-phosphatase [Candidatus Omnitrophota bacterium]
MQYSFEAIIFDLDGVITRTARVHSQSWKETFDEYLKLREERDGEPFKEFTHDGDYLPYVDGKPRYKGVQTFLQSRNINIPFGDPRDPPEKETCCGIGNRKNDKFRAVLLRDGCDIYEPTVQFVRDCKKAGIRVAVASSSRNCKIILEKAGLLDLFEARVDGMVSAERGLKGKPAGEIFVAACRDMGCDPGKSVVVEDATSGVLAGRNGGFRLVLGIARKNDVIALLRNGADIAVKDMKEITLDDIEAWFSSQPHPLPESWNMLAEPRLTFSDKEIAINTRVNRPLAKILNPKKKCVFFLDYDGTLTPIVDKPELAIMDETMRNVLKLLLKKHVVSIVSGRQREDVEKLVKIDGIVYAGSHGFDIAGPECTMINPAVKALMPQVNALTQTLEKQIGNIENVLIEKKKFSVAAHYRLVKHRSDIELIRRAVNEIVTANNNFRLMSGKMVFEILPNIEWNKGLALQWIMKALKFKWKDHNLFYIGDDVTDEYALRFIQTRGIGILVSEDATCSSAHFVLKTPKDVKAFFTKILEIT